MASYSFDIQNEIDSIGYYDASAGTYTLLADRTVISAFDLFRDDATVGDYITFAWQYMVWHNLGLTIDVPVNATGLVLVWEWADVDGVWHPLTVIDGTSNLTTSGTISFDVPDSWQSVWHRYTTPAYGRGAFIRCRIAEITSMTEGGHCNASAKLDDYAIHVVGADVTPAGMYDADQAGGWGVIEHYDNTYLCHANVWLGDNITATTLSINNFTELIIGGESAPRQMFSDYLKDLVVVGSSDDSSILKHFGNSWSPFYFYATLRAYSSLVLWHQGNYFVKEVTLDNVIFITNGGIPIYGTGGIWDEVYFVEYSGNGWLYIYGTPTINSMDLGNFIGTMSYLGNTFNNIDFSGGKLLWAYSAVTYTLINCTIDDPITTVKGRLADSTTDIKWTFNLSVKDTNNIPISGQPVVIKDKDGNIIASLTTDSNGEIPQQTLLYYNVTGIDGSETLTTYCPFTVEIGDDINYTKETYTLNSDKKEKIECVLILVPLEVSSLSFTNCSNEASKNGTITVQAQGESGNYNYSNDGGATWQASGSFTGLAEGDYEVKIKDTTTLDEIEAGVITISSEKMYISGIDGTIEEEVIDGTIEEEVINGELVEEIINGTIE